MTGNNDEIDWRIYFQNRKYHHILSRAVLDLLLLVIYASRNGGLVSERKYDIYKQRIEQARNFDLSQVYKLIYMNCETQVPVRGYYNCKLFWLMRALEENDSEYVEQNRDKIIFLSWRLREAEILCKFLKEARNAQAHDTNSRQHLGWLISIPSNILRLIEICPPNQLLKESVVELEHVCREHISKALKPQNESSDQEATELIETPNQVISTVTNISMDAIEAKIDMILKRVCVPEHDTTSSVENITTETKEEDLDSLDIHIASERYNKIDYLTPKMARDQLIRLSRSADAAMVDGMEFAPNEKLLQIAIVEEIIFHKARDIEKIFELPDVNWRYKRYSNAMEKQLEILGQEIQNILDRVIWE